MNILFPHKIIYMTEQEYIDLRLKIYKQIDNEDWDNITFPPYSLYKKCFFSEEVRDLLLMNKPYNDNTDRTVNRLFGSRQYLEEAKQYKNWHRIIYDIDQGNIKDLNDSNYPLFIHYMDHYIVNIGQKSKFDNAKFLIENGANINIQDDKGRTFLYHFIDRYKSSTCHFMGISIYIDFIEFLLENGADPLLEDKYGNSPNSILLKEISKKDYIYISKARIKGILYSTSDELYYSNIIRLCEVFYSFMYPYNI